MCGQQPSGAPNRTKSKKCVCVCVSVCVCQCVFVQRRLGAKLKVGVQSWGPVVEIPSRELGISGESTKTVINQNFGDTNDQKQRTALYPCHCVTSAPYPCHTHLRRCPIGSHPAPLDVIGSLVPERNLDPPLG